ncbi:MAG: hypothetical protein OQL27_10410 [Sedimenticola sp.]|nr:hypothetical protein [Sedimenticola sp.]
MNILTMNSVTNLDAQHRGHVLVAGSHGGLIAGMLAARAGVHALILNDAGVGKDAAGIASLDLLDTIGMAAATVSRQSVSMGLGERALEKGVISHANRHARAVGVAPGDCCREAAVKLCRAAAPVGELPVRSENRSLLGAQNDYPPIIGCDSVCLVTPDDAGAILVVGSHAAMHAADPWSALGAYAAAAFFHDAGCVADVEGISRLPVLDEYEIPAGAVDFRSARIGDAQSIWESGRLSFLNYAAQIAGWQCGMSVQVASEKIQESVFASGNRVASMGGRS